MFKKFGRNRDSGAMSSQPAQLQQDTTPQKLSGWQDSLVDMPLPEVIEGNDESMWALWESTLAQAKLNQPEDDPQV